LPGALLAEAEKIIASCDFGAKAEACAPDRKELERIKKMDGALDDSEAATHLKEGIAVSADFVLVRRQAGERAERGGDPAASEQKKTEASMSDERQASEDELAAYAGTCGSLPGSSCMNVSGDEGDGELAANDSSFEEAPAGKLAPGAEPVGGAAIACFSKEEAKKAVAEKIAKALDCAGTHAQQAIESADASSASATPAGKKRGNAKQAKTMKAKARKAASGFKPRLFMQRLLAWGCRRSRRPGAGACARNAARRLDSEWLHRKAHPFFFDGEKTLREKAMAFFGDCGARIFFILDWLHLKKVTLELLSSAMECPLA
jgi:hypothetical protein